MASTITMPKTNIIDERTGKPLTSAQCMRDTVDQLLERFAAGEQLKDIAAGLEVPGSGQALRAFLREHHAARYDAALAERGHAFLDRTIGIAEKAEQLGDGAGLRVAADVYMKLAAKLNPSELGDKSQVSLSGSIGVRSEDLSDSDLAAIAARGVTE